MAENASELLRKIIEDIISGESVDLMTIKSLLNEIIKRNRKLVESAGDNLILEILEREHEMLNECLEMLSGGLKSYPEQRIIKKLKVKVGVVNKDVPKFIGGDGWEYGPFDTKDIININEEDLALLSKNNYLNLIEEEL